jgi:hypothetical protein
MPQLKSRALELLKTVKTGEPILNLDRSVAAETLWPATLEKEADKAASILRSFFLDGFIVPYRTLGKCPQHVRLRQEMWCPVHCLHRTGDQ